MNGRVSYSEVVRLRVEQHLTIQEISERLGCCDATVRVALREAKINLGKVKKGAYPKKIDIELVKQLCAAQFSDTEIAKKLGCSLSGLRGARRRLGIKAGLANKKPEKKIAILELAEKGFGVDDICERVDASESYIKRVLRSVGQEC